MLLTEISDLIVIDEIINEKKYTHFLTHCENRFFTEAGFTSKIYTSKNIARTLYRHKKIPINVFSILQPNHATKIQLSNGQNITVTLFEGDQYTNNICFHFENSKTTCFYCGHFRNIYGLFKNQLCFDLSSIGIDYLYLDNTRANAEYISSVNEIGIRLKEIMKIHPNYKIIISLPNYGYEDLLVNLLITHNFKIFIGIHQKDILTHLKLDNYLVNTIRDAQLIIRKDIVDMDCIKERYAKKHGITVRIVEYDKEVLSQNFEHFGLYQIHYSPHVTQFELFALVAFFQPKYIREIYPEFSNLPKLLKEASLSLCVERNENNNNNNNNNNDDLSEITTDIIAETLENKPNVLKLSPPQPNEDILITKTENNLQINNNNNINNNINDQNDNINTYNNKLEFKKHHKKKISNSIKNDHELIKQCPKLIAKNIVKELFDEYVDCDNVGDNYCPFINNNNLHKHVNEIPIFNSDNSDMSKSLLDDIFYEKFKKDHEYNSQQVTTTESVIITDDVQKIISPRIGAKRNIDDKYHTPKEKHRKLLVNSGIKDTTAHIPDLQLNLTDTKHKSIPLNPSNLANQTKAGHSRMYTSLQIKNQSNSKNYRNISGLGNRSKASQKKNIVNCKMLNNLSLTELKEICDKTNKKVNVPEYSNKCFTVDCSKQKRFKRNTTMPIEYINSDED